MKEPVFSIRYFIFQQILNQLTSFKITIYNLKKKLFKIWRIYANVYHKTYFLRNSFLNTVVKKNRDVNKVA